MPKRESNPFGTDEPVGQGSGETQKPSNTEARKNRNTETQKNRDTETQSPENPKGGDLSVPSIPDDAETKKVGYYIASELDVRLEDFALQFKRKTGTHATKSKIAEAALDIVLSQHEQEGGDSNLEKWLRRRLDM
jgi:hypothetical protein